MKKLVTFAALALAFPALATAQFSPFFEEDFGLAPQAPFDAGATISPLLSGNVTDDPAFDYSTANPDLSAVPGAGNGTGLFLSANQGGEGVQAVFYTLDVPASNDYALEVNVSPYVSPDNTSGSTTWAGISVRTDATTFAGDTGNAGDGYLIQIRTDNSASFGDYINFYKGELFLGRYYFVVGSGGIATGFLTDGVDGPGENNGSKAIRDPQETSTNDWVVARLEVVDDLNAPDTTNVKLIVDGDVVVDWDDPDPISGGNAIVFHDDPFGGSASAPDGTVGGIFDRVTLEEFTGDTSVIGWELMQ